MAYSTRYKGGINFAMARRMSRHKTIGGGPASYNCQGQFDTMARKTFNIKYKRQSKMNI